MADLVAKLDKWHWIFNLLYACVYFFLVYSVRLSIHMPVKRVALKLYTTCPVIYGKNTNKTEQWQNCDCNSGLGPETSIQL